jgi:hypothetical protein
VAATAPTGSAFSAPTGLREFDLPYVLFGSLGAQGDAVACVAGGPAAEPVVFRVPADPARRGAPAGARPGAGPSLVLAPST